MDYKICYLIDDDIDEQDIFEMALTELNNGVQLIYGNDSRTAVKKLKRENFIPDYIFIDINMPQLNGWECLQEIRKIPHLAHIPIAIYSTSIPPDHKARAGDAHVTAFIRKQPNIPDLIAVLRDFFHTHNQPTHL
ncbi:response regulator [Parachryseolinea silvisoli]|uniref:response regulator n=1 Tax=Parachryseolinea silvisoli TaxID=2873601 RepID=UPI002265BD18|nr:response regulator [Parachryseolinea silvisoli]MCD9015878.1 response regulator [Parachryseolinea silvisoli]